MSTLLTVLFCINYILAVIFIFAVASDNSWKQVVEDMDEPLMEKESMNKLVRHTVSIMFLIPGYALYSLFKMLFIDKRDDTSKDNE